MGQPKEECIARQEVFESLAIQQLHMTLDVNYDAVITTYMDRIRPDVITTDFLSAYRCLRSRDARFVLAISWKESPLVLDEELTAAGLKRQFSEMINANKLTKFIIEDKADRRKVYARILEVCNAAETFGLLNKRKISGHVNGNIGDACPGRFIYRSWK